MSDFYLIYIARLCDRLLYRTFRLSLIPLAGWQITPAADAIHGTIVNSVYKYHKASGILDDAVDRTTQVVSGIFVIYVHVESRN